MCAEYELVPIPPHLITMYEFDETHPEFGIDNEGRRCYAIDKCIAPILRVLFDAGVRTTGCCCGHGKGSGVISLETRVYDSGRIPDVNCHHEGTPRAIVCQFCWAEVEA